MTLSFYLKQSCGENRLCLWVFVCVDHESLPCSWAGGHTCGKLVGIFLDNKTISNILKTEASLLSKCLQSLYIQGFIPAGCAKSTKLTKPDSDRRRPSGAGPPGLSP